MRVDRQGNLQLDESSKASHFRAEPLKTVRKSEDCDLHPYMSFGRKEEKKPDPRNAVRMHNDKAPDFPPQVVRNVARLMLYR